MNVVLTISVLVAAGISVGLLTYQFYLFLIRAQLVKDIGSSVAHLFNGIDNTKNRIILRDKLAEAQNQLSDWTLLVIADRYLWPSWAVSCLPALYFKKSENPGVIIVWKKILLLLPTALEYRKGKIFCQGEVIEISIIRNAVSIVDSLASRLEYARKHNPYPSRDSLTGVVNHIMNIVELEFTKSGKELSALPLKQKREELLRHELHLDI